MRYAVLCVPAPVRGCRCLVWYLCLCHTSIRPAPPLPVLRQSCSAPLLLGCRFGLTRPDRRRATRTLNSHLQAGRLVGNRPSGADRHGHGGTRGRRQASRRAHLSTTSMGREVHRSVFSIVASQPQSHMLQRPAFASSPRSPMATALASDGDWKQTETGQAQARRRLSLHGARTEEMQITGISGGRRLRR